MRKALFVALCLVLLAGCSIAADEGNKPAIQTQESANPTLVKATPIPAEGAATTPTEATSTLALGTSIKTSNGTKDGKVRKTLDSALDTAYVNVEKLGAKYGARKQEMLAGVFVGGFAAGLFVGILVTCCLQKCCCNKQEDEVKNPLIGNAASHGHYH